MRKYWSIFLCSSYISSSLALWEAKNLLNAKSCVNFRRKTHVIFFIKHPHCQTKYFQPLSLPHILSVYFRDTLSSVHCTVHRLNIELDLQSFPCAELFSLAETPQPPPPHLVSIGQPILTTSLCDPLVG
jgi:hypothetical protein